MANVAQQYRSMNAFVNNNTYAGRVEEFHPPQLEIMTEPYKAGGMDVPVLLDMGMEPLEGRLIINGYEEDTFGQFGLANAEAANMTVRGGLEDYDGVVKQISFAMRGNVTSLNMGRIRGRGEVPKVMLNIACTRYAIHIDGIEHIRINVLLMERFINGVDRLADLRAAIGV